MSEFDRRVGAAARERARVFGLDGAEVGEVRVLLLPTFHAAVAITAVLDGDALIEVAVDVARRLVPLDVASLEPAAAARLAAVSARCPGAAPRVADALVRDGLIGVGWIGPDWTSDGDFELREAGDPLWDLARALLDAATTVARDPAARRALADVASYGGVAAKDPNHR